MRKEDCAILWGRTAAVKEHRCGTRHKQSLYEKAPL
jgi:hypothetical protein